MIQDKSTDCRCSCGCGNKSDSPDLRWMLVRLAAAIAITVAAHWFDLPKSMKFACFGTAWFLAGAEVIISAIDNLLHGKIFDENFLMTFASAGAFAIGEMAEGAAVMIFFGVGELLQNAAVNRSRRNIMQLMDLRPDFARVRRNGGLLTVAPGEIEVGELIVVNPGERIPLDGTIRSGHSFLDTKALTGEPVPRRVEAGNEVLSGSVNLEGILELQVDRKFADSTVSRILELVRDAGNRKSHSEKFITRFARYYTPSVVGLALLVALLPPLAGFGTFADWFYRGLCFLIISCPCALVLSIPLSFFGGIGGAARQGILVKGGNSLELLRQLGTIAFDKTGTLTEGVFQVSAIHPVPDGVSGTELLRLAATAEAHSNHPIAKSILAAFPGTLPPVADLRELPGAGVIARSDDGVIYAGNAKLMRQAGITQLQNDPQTTVHIALDGRYLGRILIADRIKPEAAAALKELRALGIQRLVMLTGDNAATAKLTADELSISEFHAALLPQQKLQQLETLIDTELPGRKTAFVGDGINDAPVLTRADLGIAMGSVGSDAAIEAADVVLMTDDLRRLGTAIRIAEKTRTIVVQNIVLALGIKAAVMLLALFGFASVWFAIFADVGVALLALANALRALLPPPPGN